MLESLFQKQLIKEIQRLYPGAIILKNDSGYIQGFPDWTILYEDTWACFETKASAKSPIRPNQRYYINLLKDMCCASFVFPENKEDFLDELQYTFRIRR